MPDETGQYTKVAIHGANADLYCDLDNHYLARYKGWSLEGIGMYVCEHHKMEVRDPKEIVPGSIPVPKVECEFAGDTITPTDFRHWDTETVGYMTYAVNVKCDCGRTFKKLVTSKNGSVFIPQHFTAVGA